MIKEGRKAPAVNLPSSTGGKLALKDLAGKYVILYFYPRDDTPGCTKQAIGFTDRLEAFEEAGAHVLGVSKDSVAKHEKFRDKHGLGVTLLSDAESDVCERYGTWVEKNMYGKKSMGIQRSTFLIDSDGRIARIWRKVKVDGHVDEVLEAVRALG